MAKKNYKKSQARNKTGAWFVPVRGSYLPSSGAGWFTYLPFTAYLLFSLIIGLHDTSSIGLGILFIVPNWIAAAVIMTWLAKQKS